MKFIKNEINHKKVKHLKSYKVFENIQDIESICLKYKISNYTINQDGSIDVDGNVNLQGKDLKSLPLRFRNVSGSFYCSNNQLTSLQGSPESVVGDFYCSNNQLTSLEGSPESVGGNFNCDSNQLTSLQGSPESVGGGFDCSNNPVYTIWALFKDVTKIDLFNDFGIIQGDSVILDRLNQFLEEIGKPTVNSVSDYKNI